MSQRTKTSSLSDKIVLPSELLSIIIGRRSVRIYLLLVWKVCVKWKEILVGAEMISYDQQNPELINSKPYDIKRGFGYWLFIFGVIVAAITAMICILFFVCLIYGSILFAYVLFPMFIGLILSFTTLQSAFKIIRQPQNIRPSIISCIVTFDLIAIIVMAFTALTSLPLLGPFIYLLHICEKAVTHPSLDRFFMDNNTPPNTENKVILFDNWDPIIAYGKFMTNVSIPLCIIFLLLFHLSHLEWHLSISVFLLLCSIVGIGFSKKKEWARTLGIAIHGSMFVLPFLSILNQGIFDSQFVFLVVLFTAMTPLWHWCYFVIRTLNHPVVRGEFLRGGRILDDENVPDLPPSNNGEPRI